MAAIDDSYTWEERKEQYNSHYFVEYGTYVTPDGKPSYDLGYVIGRCKDINKLLDVDSVLACGCGPGWLIHGFSLLRPNMYIRGLDVSYFAISHSDISIRDKLVVGDISEGLPFGYMEFDLVTGFDILEHLYPYFRILNAVKEMCRVAKKWILLRQPMTQWEGEGEEWHKWLGTLNDLPHKVRLTLVDTISELRHTSPIPGNKEHPSEHPREFWVELFRSNGFSLIDLPEEIYHFPNPNYFCSFNLLVFKRGL